MRHCSRVSWRSSGHHRRASGGCRRRAGRGSALEPGPAARACDGRLRTAVPPPGATWCACRPPSRPCRTPRGGLRSACARVSGRGQARRARDEEASTISRSWAIDSALLTGRAQVRPALEALGVPGAERAELVDHPALAAARRGRASAPDRRDVPEAFGFPVAVVEQQVDVVEQELPALLAASPRAARGPRAGRAPAPGSTDCAARRGRRARR